MKKTLLSLGMALFAAGAVAQVTFPVKVGFENADKTDKYHCQYALTPGVSEFGDWVNPHTDNNDLWEEQNSGEQVNGDYCFMAQNNGEKMNPWDRGFKLANLPIKENTSYRMSFWVKGEEGQVVTAWLSKGLENLDKSFISSSNSGEYGINQRVMSGEWEHMSFVAYYEGAAPYNNWLANTSWAGTASFPEQFGGAGESYRGHFNEAVPEIFFAIINMFDGGTYYLDDICIEEGVTFNQATFNGTAIKLDFGYDTNAKTLAASNKRGYIVLDKTQFSATKNGKDVEVLGAEIQSDGFVYVFLAEDAEGATLSFTPNEDCPLEYADNRRPTSDFTTTMKVLGFQNETLYEDQYIDVEMHNSELADLESCVPEAGSFDLPVTTNEFTFTFDLAVDPSLAIINLTNENGIVAELSVSAGEDEKTLVAKYDGKNLKKGNYVIELEVANEVGDASFFSVPFNVGEYIYDPEAGGTETIFDSAFEKDNNNTIPSQGTLSFAGIQNPGEGRGSGARLFTDFAAGGQWTAALYSRDWDGDGWYEIGTREDEELILQPGKHSLSFTHGNWKGDNTNMNVKIFLVAEDGTWDENSVIFEETYPSTYNVNGSKAIVSGAHERNITFDVPEEARYGARFTGSGEYLIANIKLQYVPDLAGIEYKTKLFDAVAAAYDWYYSASGFEENDRYLGEDYNALFAMIQKYQDPADWTKADALGMTAPSQYNAAVAEINAALDGAKEFKSLIDKYDALRVEGGEIAQLLESTSENKVARMECWSELKAAYEKYADKDLTDKDELREACKIFSENMVTVRRWNGDPMNDDGTKADPWAIPGNIGIKAYTYRTDLAIKAIESMNPDYTDEEVEIMLKGMDTMVDDNNLVNELKKIATKYYYNAMKNEETQKAFFSEKYGADENGEEGMGDMIFDGVYDFSFFLTNPNIYIVTSNGNMAQSLEANNTYDENGEIISTTYSGDACPGWTVSDGAGSWSTGWTSIMKEGLPIEAMGSNWKGSAYTMSQTIEDLPAGLYILKGGVTERDVYQDDSYFFWQTSGDEEPVTMPVPNAGQAWSTGNISSEYRDAEFDESGKVITVDEEGNTIEVPVAEPIEILDGKLTIGAHAGASSCIFINNFQLFLVGASKTFDYAGAVVPAVDGVEGLNNRVVNVAVYDMNGRQVVRANKGVNIIKRTYSDGTVTMSKYLVK